MNVSRPKALRYVHAETSRHGAVTTYFRRGHEERIRLPNKVDSPEFREAYRRALAGELQTPRPERQTVDKMRRGRVGNTLTQAIRSARVRAAKVGRDFDLSLDWAIAKVEEQDFRCVLTGIPFYGKHESPSFHDPFAPSFDRIDPKNGYTTDNVRIVIFAVNVMLQDWGEDIFLQVVNAYRAKERRGFRISIPNRSGRLG